MLDAQGHCRIADVGLSRYFDDEPKSMCRTCTSGTPSYMAPEVLQARPHGRAADWFAVGVVLFEFMTGVKPFSDSGNLIFRTNGEFDDEP